MHRKHPHRRRQRLRRQCERATPTRRAACPLFWTLGSNQVGKAAISGWQEVIAPAQRHGQSSELPIDRGHPDWKIEASEQGAHRGKQLVHKRPRITHWTRGRHLPSGIYPRRARNPALLRHSAPVSVEQASKRYKN
jgi:hypothetical protein